MASREDELQELIASQKADLKAGDFQPGEPGVSHYDNFGFEGSIEAFVNMTTYASQRRKGALPECAYHGRAVLVLQPGTFNGWRCRACTLEATHRYRATPKGRASANKANRRWARKNADRTREINRASYHRRMQDPAYRAKKNEQARLRKRRYTSMRAEEGN